MKALVTGAGGFIGGHLVKYLKGRRYEVRGADIKLPEYDETVADEFMQVDLRELDNCMKATAGVDEVYHLAADMGGIGYITANLAGVSVNNTWIDSKMLEASRRNKVGRIFYSSSACAYPAYRQEGADVTPLKESDAYPAMPEAGYGWEKLYAEKLFEYYANDYGMNVSVARFHNIYGPYGTYDGGKEKAPAAISRKIAKARDGDTIEVWGDGEQTRSFMYVDDCVDGIYRLTQSDFSDPVNLGTDRLVTVNELVDMIAAAAGKRIEKRHDTSQAQGVRGRNSDNSLLMEVLNWEPPTSLEDGLRTTYKWIEEQVSVS